VRLQIACLQVAMRTAHRSPGAPQATASRVPSRRARLAMGTTLEISVCAENEARAGEAIEAAFAEVDRLERILSTFREDSETSRLNRGAGGDFQPASPELLDLLARSREFSAASHGAFDVAAGSLVTLWKRAAGSGSLPGAAELAAARGACGPGVVETDPEHGRVRLARAGATLDFGGIGKGYALDRAAVALQDRGVTCALLDFGGQLLALDPPSGEAGWKVDLRDPRDAERIRRSIRLVRASISTTADYERGLEIAGARISHVVDPRTGLPVEADALSTALYVLGPQAGAELARRRSVAALLVPAQGSEIANEAFRALEIPRGALR